MSGPPVPLRFRARAEAGFVLSPAQYPALRRVRKRPVEVMVEPVLRPLQLQTPEGPLQLLPGDVILDDGDGRRWGMSRAQLMRRYDCLDPSGQRWRSRPLQAQALQPAQAFEVQLFLHQSALLQGQPDDWLLDYGDGSLGVVAGDVFALSYEILEESV
ncbi:PGDYG domain-containing protein [Kinneretia asaccharophila]|uniref:PGDYG protein n=1 Tax=Roseateles asaccharophilus TaxID=582607 RepID=A0A4R6NA04_9BURK|nr:PGDYG domain-containing protein [Roseateles asaccharophilus]MDN3544890.1 PGDYG domain-containing protein [Roseateles asaccharophilus]TDP12723.1 PGDYG protein [Roseateles asaccharophilus]